MKRIAMALACIAGPAGVLMAQNNVVIKGTVTGDLKGHTQVYVYGPGITSDTAEIVNGKFEFNIPYKAEMVPIFYDEYDVKVKKGVSPYMVLVDRPGTINLDGIDIEKGLQTGKISGMKSAVDYLAYQNKEDEISKEVGEQLKKKYGEKISPSSPEYQAWAKEQETLLNQKKLVLINKLISADNDAYVAAYVLGSDGKRFLSADEMEGLYNKLSKRLQQTQSGKTAADFIQGTRRSAIGQTVQNFTVLTPEEKQMQFNDLKGKYVVLDFWASWCGPCVKSFPHMKEVYKKYKSDKFEIFSISVDQSKDAWYKALKQYELPWTQALDTSKIATSHFAVTGIPTVYLIDPSGKILAKEMGFDDSGKGEIEQKLSEIFGEK